MNYINHLEIMCFYKQKIKHFEFNSEALMLN